MEDGLHGWSSRVESFPVGNHRVALRHENDACARAFPPLIMHALKVRRHNSLTGAVFCVLPSLLLNIRQKVVVPN